MSTGVPSPPPAPPPARHPPRACQVAGVYASTAIIPRMSKQLFMRLEYALMTFASLKLIDAGLKLGYLG